MAKQEEMSAADFQRLHGGKAKGKQKYSSEFATADGKKFRSKKEARRYGDLRLLERLGRIKELRCQIPFPIVIHRQVTLQQTRVGVYFADFTYTVVETGLYVVEDVKGFRLPLYKFKKRCVEAMYGIKITEI